MKRILGATCCCFIMALFVAACGDTTIKGPVPISGTVDIDNGGIVVNVHMQTCEINEQCDEREICAVSLAASEKSGQRLSVCKAGCDVELDPQPDGTVMKTAGTDTCQREGNGAIFCDPSPGVNYQCRELTDEEIEAATDSGTPSTLPPPSGTPGPTTNLTTLQCCYAGATTGLFGQFAWSESTAADPEAWKAAEDMAIDANGCFDGQVDMTKVFRGFWVDMTQGAHAGKPAAAVTWIGAGRTPSHCYVGGVEVRVGTFQATRGWPFATAAQ